jgi:hypothetical protein
MAFVPAALVRMGLLKVRPTAISRITQGFSRDHNLTNRHRAWLDLQTKINA